MKKWILISSLSLGLCYSVSAVAFSEKNVEVYSQAMNKNIPVTIVLPEGYASSNKYSTIYTLHGWSGNNRNYPEKTGLGELADQYNVIYVSPDGNYDSWYVDSELKKESKYYTFVAKELVDYVDKHYATHTDKTQRAITGLSMGGFGALYIGIKNQDRFGNVGSMSGGVNIEQYKNNWGISAVVNSNWQDYNIKDLAHGLIFTKSNIIFDCGVDDFFIEPNRALHQKLLDLNIPHHYIEKPGGHSWVYWKDSIALHTHFFSQKFAQAKAK
ncbi:alpha/beta hydrolase [Pasteurella multocida]|uniref:alpha/beta hydrolase n=1 Tax=Pasteurella multocida TaxID=747 RepID=UPI001F533CCE|nr:alpha/beta hydrolase family protein [Pasteurella multocida]